MGDVENYFLSFFAGLGFPECNIEEIEKEIYEDRTTKESNNFYNENRPT